MNLEHFADDTNILCTKNSLVDLKISMPETLEKLNGYMNENKLVLDVDKIELTDLQGNRKCKTEKEKKLAIIIVARKN